MSLMELKFDARQEYQLDAIQAIVDLLEGQPHVEADLRFAAAPGYGGAQSSFAAVPNRLDLTETEIEQMRKLGYMQ